MRGSTYRNVNENWAPVTFVGTVDKYGHLVASKLKGLDQDFDVPTQSCREPVTRHSIDRSKVVAQAHSHRYSRGCATNLQLDFWTPMGLVLYSIEPLSAMNLVCVRVFEILSRKQYIEFWLLVLNSVISDTMSEPWLPKCAHPNYGPPCRSTPLIALACASMAMRLPRSNPRLTLETPTPAHSPSLEASTSGHERPPEFDVDCVNEEHLKVFERALNSEETDETGIEHIRSVSDFAPIRERVKRTSKGRRDVVREGWAYNVSRWPLLVRQTKFSN